MQHTEQPSPVNPPTDSPRTLGLRIPAGKDVPENCMFLDPQKTSEWVASLPLANVGETSRQVYTKLGEFNHYGLPTDIRLKETEAFRSIVAYISDNLRRHYMDASFPLPPKAWKTLILSRELNNELANSYKIIVENLLQARGEKLDKKLLIIGIQRALHYLGQVYLQVCLSYSATPPRIWKEINTLFAFARRNFLHRVPVKMKSDKGETTCSIEDQYKALMLFATASPSRMPQIYLEYTFAHAPTWAKMTEFLDPQDQVPDNSSLNVFLSMDEPPIHNALRSPVLNGPIAILDVGRLVQHLEQEYRELRGNNGKQAKFDSSKPSRSLLVQLIRSWRSPSERKFHRTKLNFSLKVYCGLRAIHSGLLAQVESVAKDGGGNALASATNDFSLLEDNEESSLSILEDSAFSATLGPASGSNLHHDWGMGQDVALPSNGQLESFSGILAGPGGDLNPASENTVTTINESSSGYCFRWPEDHTIPKTRVGELVGVGNRENEGAFGLGIVRWMRCVEQTELEVGLQLISKSVEPARAYPALAAGKVPLRTRKDPISCLMAPLPHAQKKGQSSLVFGSNSYTPGSHLWVESIPGGELKLIRLLKLIDFSGMFAQYQFEYVDPNGDQDEIRGNRTEFEALWKSL